ncbi:ubiquitin-associated protein 2a isoform X2 [Sander lucioperca]|uniref:ubiquitin-associated protein 2a isoform X2 n=1 Tax=Sander lucioperca TaxID=283035 RepID=UPI001653C72A|nr:ubiquitin-associated protein 2a isoform X2 [Sander lucioperca]
MMSSLGSEKARGPREKALPAVTHTSQPQKQIQATAEQIRLAQVIYDKNDADFEDKVNQLMEVTGKNQDECMVALHDCNEDVSRAINFLLESTSDMTSWETVGKKKPLVKEGPSDSKENKENREKKGEREVSKGRVAANRKGRGASRSRQARPEENGVEVTPVDRGSDRGRRARGGGRGSGGRGRGPPGSRFSAQGMGIFNPADYTSEAGSGTTQTEVWDTVANNSTDGTVTWRHTMEDWASEEWSEDVSLSETKVFTSSCAPAAENHITPGQSLDLASLLQKPVVGGREPPSSSSSQSLVFTNSHHHHQPPQQQPPHSRNATSSTSYAHAALSSVLGAGFGDLGQAKRTQPSAGAQILEQLKGPGLGPLPSSQAAPPASTQGSNTSIGRMPGLGAPVPPPSSSSWDIKLSESTSLSSQFSREFGLQPEPSLVLSQLVQRHTGPSLPLARQPSPPSQQQTPPASASPTPHHTSSPAQTGLVMAVTGAKPPAPGTGLDPQGGSTPQQQRAQLKAQKRRIPPTSKIPSTAVEMPGSADIPGLNLQFGALDFGSESAMPEFGVVDNCVSATSRESTPAPCPAPPSKGPGTQSQTSLYSKPLSESLGSPLSVALPLPLSSSEPGYHSSVPLPTLTPSSLGTANSSNPPSCSSTASTTSSSVPSSSHFSTVGGSYDGTMPPHTRLAFSQSKEATGPVMNGLNGVRTSAALDTSSASSTPKTESPSMNITNGTSAPSSLLPSTLPAHSSTTLSNLAQDLPTASHLNSLNSHVSSHSSVSALGSSSLTYTSVDNSSVSSLAPSTGSYSSSQPSALHSTHNSSNSSSSGISHLANMGNNMSSTVAGIVGISGLHSAAIAASTALGLGSNGATATSNLSAPRTAPLLSSSTGKAPPNLSQGVPPLLPNQYIMGPGGLLPAYPIYGYEDLHMLQSRLPMPSLQDYYGITFPGPTATLSGRDGSLANNPYSGEVTKFGRNDSTSPAPPTSLAAPQPPQGQSQGQSQAQPPQAQPQGQPQHHSSQQAFLPPGYSYTGLPYYAGVPGAVPSAAAFQYGHTMFVPPGGPGPASAKQHSMGLGLGNPTASPFQQQTQQQPSGYGQHTFSSGYEELTAGPAGVDYSKGYNSSSQAQAKSAASGPGKGVSVTSSNSGVPDISGSVYNKTQSFDKQGFHAGTPPPFSLPSALGGPGPLNPGAAPGGYAPAPFLHILPHQQPHSQLLHHHLAQDGQGGPSQRGQSSSLQQKSQVNKSSYGSSPYWAN